MPRAAIFFIHEFEETEGVTTVDLLRRAGVEVDIISLEKDIFITGSHRITIKGDLLFSQLQAAKYDMLIIPGGTLNYLDHQEFMSLLAQRGAAGQKLAAICAAPAVLGKLGLLKGKKAVCYPGFEKELLEATIVKDNVVTSGTITTSKGPSTALVFALELIGLLVSPEMAQKIKTDILLA
jgi:4-methyl-5(b-hydroxyethyl)-thiazole monophosphate biosynthesis